MWMVICRMMLDEVALGRWPLFSPHGREEGLRLRVRETRIELKHHIPSTVSSSLSV